MKVREGRTSGQAEEEGGTKMYPWTHRRAHMAKAEGECIVPCLDRKRDPWARNKEGQDLPSSGGKTRKSRGGGGVTT